MLQVFNANNGRSDIVKHNLVGVHRAKFIRFQPTNFKTRKALRVEVYGLIMPSGIATNVISRNNTGACSYIAYLIQTQE